MATLGIDFGTSNSACGVLVNGKPWLIDIEPGARTIPTAVFFDADTQRTLFGEAANRALIDGRDGRYMRALKSVLGTPLMRERRAVMHERLDFIDIIARFLDRIRRRAEAATGQTFDRALSGRPVRFHSSDERRNDQALADLRECYERAGFDAVAFLPEPEAAAIANGALGGDGIGLIVDIGGGTSDFTVFRPDNTAGLEVLASGGVRVGGTDFDRTLSLIHVMPLLGYGGMIRPTFGAGALPAPRPLFQDLATWEKIPFVQTPQTLREVRQWERLAVDPRPFSRLGDVLENHMGHDIAFAVERGKIAANGGRGRVALGAVERGLAVDLTREGLNDSLRDHADTIGACARLTCDAAGIAPDDISRVVFVGGSSLLHVIEAAMARLFPKARFHRSDPFTGVVDGLAIASATAFPT
ncbi:Hsp70 family protein [Oceaniglobus indicus]|uniref:Hsp70 family protein n=1 Tax=Oceaniglobus indicus TaxID=2047749 RepID=UPI000C1A324A|nr:Hsp70 family protein [Oceaniglobus indicus]